MKKILMPCVILFVIAGCDLIRPGPKDILTKYLTNYQKGNYSESYALLSSKDRAFKNQKDFEAELRGNPFTNLFIGKISFNVRATRINGNVAEVAVEITQPDPSKAISDLFGIAFLSVLGKKDSKEIEKMIIEKLKDKPLPMVTETQSYNLVKEKEGWRVFLNWEGQKRAGDLVEQAANMEKNKKFNEARAKYQEAISWDKNNNTAREKIGEIDKIIEKYKIKQAYFNKIEVRNIQLGNSILDEFGVFGEVKNNGDKTLNKVEITIYCLDKNDKVIFEKTYLPVLVSEYSFMSDNKPLRPNYSRRFGCKLNDAPSDWSRKVRVEVTDVEFE